MKRRDEFDVTMERADSVFGTVISTRRVFARSRRGAIAAALAEADAIWKHDWKVVGVYSYAGELGRGCNT